MWLVFNRIRNKNSEITRGLLQCFGNSVSDSKSNILYYRHYYIAENKQCTVMSGCTQIFLHSYLSTVHIIYMLALSKNGN